MSAIWLWLKKFWRREGLSENPGNDEVYILRTVADWESEDAVDTLDSLSGR
jgi:hypothetical protein